jgi:tripartite-type tricarboxylate transporter receptor subunit TctC
MLAPAHTPKDVTSRLAREVARIMGDAAVKERIVGLGGDAMGLGGDEATAFVLAERDKWAKVVRDAGVQPTD